MGGRGPAREGRRHVRMDCPTEGLSGQSFGEIETEKVCNSGLKSLLLVRS